MTKMHLGPYQAKFNTTIGATEEIPFVDKSGALLIAGYESIGEKLLIGTAKDRFFDSFFDFDTSPTGNWEILEPSAGMSISGPIGGAAVGASPYINLNSGIGAGDRLVIASRQWWRAPLDLRYQLSASQRIANNAFRIGFVECNPETGQLLTDVTYTTAPAVLNARNAVMAEWSGVTATTGSIVARTAGGGLDTLAAAYGTGYTTVATGTAPNLIAAVNFGLAFERDRISARGFVKNALTNLGGQFAMDSTIPNPTKSYRLVMLVENGSTAPASATDWRVHLVNVLDGTRLDVAPRAAGRTDGAQAFPVWLNGGTVTTVSTVTSATIQATPLNFAETTTNLAASATYSGAVRDMGSAALYKEFSVLCTSPTAGTLRILQGAATPPTYVHSQVAVAANTPVELNCRVAARYIRVEFVNSAVAQTGSSFQIISAAYRT